MANLGYALSEFSFSSMHNPSNPKCESWPCSIWPGSFSEMSVIILWACVVTTIAAFSCGFNPISGLKTWEQNREAYLKKMKPVSKCFSESAASDIMRTINSQQSSSIPLPLTAAIHIEYDNWLAEDWFPNERELAEMNLDDVA